MIEPANRKKPVLMTLLPVIEYRVEMEELRDLVESMHFTLTPPSPLEGEGEDPTKTPAPWPWF